MKTLFVSVTGSKLFGTNTPESDTDFKGFAFAPKHTIAGPTGVMRRTGQKKKEPIPELVRFEQKSFKSDVEDGPDKTEGTVWELAKYIRQCLQGDPTSLEPAFADPKFHLFTTPIGLEIVDYVQKNLLGKHMFAAYNAYHRSQMRKLQSQDRIGKRAAVVAEHGYDCKFAMHAYRLAKQCTIIMRDGVLQPTLNEEDREEAMKIRTGKEFYTLEGVLEVLQKMDDEMYAEYKKSTFREEPDYIAASMFIQDIHFRYVAGEFDSQLTKEFDFESVSFDL